MKKSKKRTGAKTRPVYEKPVFEKTKGMTFPAEIIQKFNGRGYGCLQCSSCHGCQ